MRCVPPRIFRSHFSGALAIHFYLFKVPPSVTPSVTGRFIAPSPSLSLLPNFSPRKSNLISPGPTIPQWTKIDPWTRLSIDISPYNVFSNPPFHSARLQSRISVRFEIRIESAAERRWLLLWGFHFRLASRPAGRTSADSIKRWVAQEARRPRSRPQPAP